MTKNQHRARLRLEAMSGLYRGLFRALPEVRAQKQNWPDYIYVPVLELMKQLPNFLSQEELTWLRSGMLPGGHEVTAFIYAGVMLATWRITQGIYRFDETLYPHLIDTDVGKIPVDVLCRLPEWCVYLETPGLMMPDKNGSSPIYGAWVQIESVEQDGANMILDITPDMDHVDYERGLITMETQMISILPTQALTILHGSTVKESIAATLATWAKGPPWPGRSDLGNDVRDEIVDKTFSWVNPIINLLLYLCAGADYAGAAPRNPQPKKTKRHGVKLFPANSPTVWDVGVRMGATLRAAHADRSIGGDGSDDGGQGGQVGRHVRPHYRRAHWHIVLSGPRLTPDGKPIPAKDRRSELQWRLLTAVNAKKRAGDDDNMPAVIRPVK